jgi:hypothetical protein
MIRFLEQLIPALFNRLRAAKQKKKDKKTAPDKSAARTARIFRPSAEAMASAFIFGLPKSVSTPRCRSAQH